MAANKSSKKSGLTNEKKKKIVKWFWIAFSAPFALLFLFITAVILFADLP